MDGFLAVDFQRGPSWTCAGGQGFPIDFLSLYPQGVVLVVWGFFTLFPYRSVSVAEIFHRFRFKGRAGAGTCPHLLVSAICRG